MIDIDGYQRIHQFTTPVKQPKRIGFEWSMSTAKINIESKLYIYSYQHCIVHGLDTFKRFFSLAWQNGAINTSRAVQAIAENVLPGNLRIHRGPKQLQQLRVHRVGRIHPWALIVLFIPPDWLWPWIWVCDCFFSTHSVSELTGRLELEGDAIGFATTPCFRQILMFTIHDGTAMVKGLGL